MSEIQFVSRYDAIGGLPDPATMCHECDGMGCYPVNGDGIDEVGGWDCTQWKVEHARVHTLRARLKAMRDCDFLPWYRRLAILWERCDGWHFIKCPACKGSRIRGDDSPSSHPETRS